MAPVGGDDAQRAAREELRKAIYHRDDPSPVEGALHWLGQRLDHLTSGSIGGSAWLILLILLAVLIGLAVARAGRPRRRARLGAGTDPLAPARGIDHRRLAAELAAQGRSAEALREWLRAAVASIEERGILDARPGRTGTEIASEAGQLLPTAAGTLTLATRAFDEIWFGGRRATDADVEAGRDAAEAARSARVERAAPVRTPSGYTVPS